MEVTKVSDPRMRKKTVEMLESLAALGYEMRQVLGLGLGLAFGYELRQVLG